MKNILLLISLVLTTYMETSLGQIQRYQNFHDPISVGDVAKPEDGAAFSVITTTESSLPCPKMTEVQRDALNPIPIGSCIFNSTAQGTQFYNGTNWINAGSSAVLSEWQSGSAYGVGAFVYTTPDYKLWIASTSHTAGATFAGDSANWEEASNDLDKIASSTDNAIMRWDGVSGDVPQNSGVLIDDTNNVSGVSNLSLSGDLTAGSLTQNSVLFSGAGGLISEDTANLLWDDAADVLTVNDFTFEEDLISMATGSELFIHAGTAGNPSILSLSSENASSTDDSSFRIYGRGKQGVLTNSEYLSSRWDTLRSNYVIDTNATGTGTLRALELRTQGNANQLLLNTDGSVSMSGNMSVAGSAQFDSSLDGLASLTAGALGAIADGTDGQLMTMVAGAPAWADAPVSTTLTTKGDLQGHNGTSNVRVPVGTDGQVLTADSSAPSGVSYQDAAATMQDAYDNSTDGDIVVDATRGSVQIQDASTAIGSPLFEVLTNDALTTYFSASANGITLENGVTINGFLDEDDLVSDSASSVPTQQSVKAYVDQRVGNSRMNLLEDPSFEKGTTSEVGCLGASKTVEEYDETTNPTAVVEVTPYNTKSLKVTTSSVSDGLKNFCEVSKSVNSEWTTSTNVIKAFRYNIPESNVYDYKLVSYADGAIDEYSDGTDVEIPLVKSGNWELAVIPTMSGTTSNGWRLEYANNGQTAVNENFYLDELEIRAAGSSDSFRVDDTDTDWVSFTPTFVNLSLGDGTLRNFSYARAGDSILIKGEIIFGSTTSVSGRIGVTLPSSLSADLEDNFSQMSNVFMYDSSATSNSTTGRTTILTSSPTIVNIDALSGITSATTPFSWASGDVLTIEPTNIPIQGWSTGNVDAMRQTQELVKVEAYGNGGGAYTSGNSITFDTEAKDNFNAWATNTFTSPRDTCYRVDGGLLFDTPVAGIITVSGGRLADGTLSGRKLGEADSRTNPGFGGEICANSGDTLTFSINASANMVDDSGGFHYLVIKEDPDLRDAILKLKDTQISKVEDKYTETEKEWGKWNGQQLYRRCFTVGSDVTATGTLFTWDAGLRPVNSLNWQGSLYTLLSHTQNGSSTDRVFIFYNSTDGDIEIAADGTASWGAYTGTSFCMDYTK